MTDIRKLVRLIADDLLSAYRESLDDASQRFPLGKYDQSKLYKTANTAVEQGDALKFILLENFYGQYLDRGRNPGVKKVPIAALLGWIKAKKIKPKPGQSENSLAFAIQNSIFKRGIQGRLYRKPAYDLATVRFEEAVENVFLPSLVDDLTKVFA